MPLWASLLQNTNFGVQITTRRWNSTLRRIDKLLIANRGEIACRVLRTARRLGVKTVAVYSDADKNSLHVSQADEAYNIGPPQASQSYLRGDKILEVAHKSGCQAIHPGYGFLSENVEFAENCEKNKIIFMGPPASAIRDMGIKSKSKEIMSKAGVPIIGGYHGEDQDRAKLKAEALKIGFPVMIKAVRGGGGKGMRIALTESEFEEALESAKSEAQKAFGDSVVLLEKFVQEPRHVEVQVFADMHGNAVHLFERDCSVQRRHQKIIEEAPAPGISEELRAELGAAAVRAAKAVGYVGAGTVEFILDRKSHNFHFMEMNTRLQVEHPITEMITGTDLVEWQIKVARGEKLPLTQEEITLSGHAFESRIYAEDPSGGFLPGAGVLSYLSSPQVRDDMRIETGIREGDEVSVHYDPMIAKLVVWGQNRSESLLKMQSLLLQYNVAGLETNVNFLLDLVRHPEFISGNVHTNFIKENNDSLFKNKTVTPTQITQAALSVVLKDELLDMKNAMGRNDQFNPFVVESGFRINHNLIRDVKMKFKDEEKLVKVKFIGHNTYHISLDEGKTWSVVQGEFNKESLKSTIDGITTSVNVFRGDDVIAIFDDSGKVEFNLEKPSFVTIQEDDSSAGGSLNRAVAPMPGVIDKVLVSAGDQVKKGDSLFVLIAMKMEHVVKADRDAVIENIYFKVGDNVQKDVTVIQFKEENVSS
ncbi:methylcrotonoyl-CoA carboxylase subunit alpha, mitochondrial [Tribolium castaneum]|uniref:Methylcrotonoyl-CoA carboxylase subunit alpha, mitochondrial-like Protein n=1 Tax=Tribolium castaneum TaxID=7070 RepID=D6WKZ0_TRICA|nr:PREDICTED: methylcrotonoyl-CoA carboxylase subunit alpha, mitochondrial [Tribolium castaneum]EFA03540.1 Methylcrotonoyl-CoA carboxylase subunit alpha, mitochondrial-like Protein [Tribolium castaneum]|eukprot:XP_008193651.1 PREDICTED: methylcrotonoyl-CoA carboxylase subunit alpha, mitochondrial [Tribolium castaneum]